MPQSGDNTPVEPTSESSKQPWEPPALTVQGDAVELTQTGGINVIDAQTIGS